MTPGERVDADNTAVVAIQPHTRLLHGDLAQRTFEAVARWIRLNTDTLIDYSDGRASTVDLVKRLEKL